MTNDDLKQHVKSVVFNEQGIKISDDDPLLAYVLTNKIVHEALVEPVVSALEALPGALAETLERVIAAVEEAERSSEQLANETKGTMTALAKLQVESAHQRIADCINDAVLNGLNGPLEKANVSIAAIERKAVAVSASTANRTTSLVVASLAGALMVVTVMFSLGLYMLYTQGKESRSAASYWHGQYLQKVEPKTGSGAKR